MADSSGNSRVLQHVACFQALVRIVETIQAAARSPQDCQALQRLTCAYLTSFRALYGEKRMIIKFHMIHHHAPHLDKCQAEQLLLPSCFCLERKHKGVKKYANNIQNLGEVQNQIAYDITLIRELTTHHVAKLFSRSELFYAGASLLKPRDPPKRLQASVRNLFALFGCDHVQVAHKAMCNKAFTLRASHPTLASGVSSPSYDTKSLKTACCFLGLQV